jgi:lipoate-protein ligase B
MTLGDYLRRLQATLLEVLGELGLSAALRPGTPDIWIGDRPIACVGVAVREWVTYHGAVLNVNPDLEPFRYLRTSANHLPMTSLERECRRSVRPSQVRERLLHHFAQVMGFDRITAFSDHPLLSRKARADAFAATC